MNPERLQAAIDAVVERVDPDQIILFGSAVRDELTAESDIDLLVIKDRPKEDPATWQERWECESGDQLDVVIMNRETAERYRRSAYYVQGAALEEGRSIYTRAGIDPVQTGPTYSWNGSTMVKTTKFEPDHATELIEKAERWQRLADKGEHAIDSCQVGREALELGLKSLIVATGRRVVHTHDLNELWDQAEEGTDRIGATRNRTMMDRLTQYSGGWRYDTKDENPEETWERSRDTIVDVINDAKRRIPKLIQQTRMELETEQGDEHKELPKDPRAETRRVMAEHDGAMTSDPGVPGAERREQAPEQVLEKKRKTTPEH